MNDPETSTGEPPTNPSGEANDVTPGALATPQALRIWPAVLFIVCLWSLRSVAGLVEETSLPVMMASFMGPLVCSGLILLWWLFFSRASVREKLWGAAGVVVILIVTTMIADKSIRGFGTMLYAIPWGMTGFAGALVLSDRKQAARRTKIAMLVALLFFGYWDLVRLDEIRGDFKTSRSWRWEPTTEELFVKSLADRPQELSPAAQAVAAQPLAAPEWPAFRGPDRDGVQPKGVLAEDWEAQPIQERWRIKIGPGWSSFSVAGDRLFTQEQRGDYEVVTCYDAGSGSELWAHQDESRFWEVVGGAGPRATPTISDRALYALGANGHLNRLDPISGEQIWQSDINDDAGREPPQWGYASSPLVTNGVVIVHAGGPDDMGLLAYDIENGELRWNAPAGDHSYSSPQLAELCGQTCVLILTNQGLTLVDPADGTVLGKHAWVYEGYRVVQPLIVGDTDVLLGTAMGTGTQRIQLGWDGESFSSKEVWELRRMNPYYNDYVAFNGYLYGFDSNIFACVDLETGERKWKKGRYGNGQVLLLPSAEQLLVISEGGKVVLLKATSDQLTELATYQALTGRTWNHPVLIGDRLYVRNGEEAVCLAMPMVRSDGD